MINKIKETVYPNFDEEKFNKVFNELIKAEQLDFFKWYEVRNFKRESFGWKDPMNGWYINSYDDLYKLYLEEKTTMGFSFRDGRSCITEMPKVTCAFIPPKVDCRPVCYPNGRDYDPEKDNQTHKE